MTDEKRIESLQEVLRHSTARFKEAVENLINGPFKVYDIEGGETTQENRIFQIPMVPFKWVESFEGLQTMMIDDNMTRTICCCKSTGKVRLPPFYHRRNERIIVLEGSIYDFLMQERHGPDSIIDFPRYALRDLEFDNCVFNIILTPPLDYKKDENL